MPNLIESHASATEPISDLCLLRVMAVARECDRREGLLVRQSRGWFHVGGSGHEGLASIAYVLRPDDWLFPYYRDRALCLARGLSPYEMALDFFAARESSSGGRQMPCHFSCGRLRIFSVATPIASQCLPAAGAAMAIRRQDGDSVVLCTVGDAALRQGEYYEALALAVQERLPVVFVVEDNGLGISTRTEPQNPYRLGILAMDGVVRVNGREPRRVHAAAAVAVGRARDGRGPTVLWCDLDRLCSHTSSDDHRVYRTAEEIAAMRERDPIARAAAELCERGELDAAAWERLQEDVEAEVEEAYAQAERAERPDAGEAAEWLYAPEPAPEPPPVAAAAGTTMVAVLNETLRAGLAADPRVVLFGEDIEDPKGGVFGLTRGLSRDFPGRVMNSPLAEATIAGIAVGMAAAGLRPVFEFQFIDFAAPAMSQILNQVASLRWRTCGDWACPATFIAPAGAYLPAGGPWHSQTGDGLWTHIPGLQVGVPSTPADAAGMLWSAMRGENPTLILVPKHVFRKRVDAPACPTVPVGQAVVRREGVEVTVAAWGNCVEVAEEAAERAAAEGMSAEVIDLRWLNPCDWDGLERSLRKTGRLVVVDEDSRTGSFGQAIVGELTSRSASWDTFLSGPRLVARKDVHVPYCPDLEYAVLPDVDGVLEAVRAAMC